MNLIIDGNSFLNVACSIVKKTLRDDHRVGEIYWVQDLMNDGEFLLKEKAKIEFRSFALKYLNSIVSSFTGLKSVQIVFDSASWRKTYIQDAFSDLDGDSFSYKGHRKYDDYQYLFYVYFQQEIIPTLEETKLLSFRVPGAEGDDIIARIIENNSTQDFCIWSTDLDFFQLLEDAARKVILITPKMGKNSKKAYTTKGFKKTSIPQTSSFDIFSFSMQAEERNTILELEQKGFEHSEVDPRTELIKKIIAGDSSDNIPRVHKNMTPKKVEALVQTILQKTPAIIAQIDSEPAQFIDDVLTAIKTQNKVPEGDLAIVLRNLTINVNSIRLKGQFFPDEIREAIDTSINRYVPETFNLNKLRSILSHN